MAEKIDETDYHPEVQVVMRHKVHHDVINTASDVTTGSRRPLSTVSGDFQNISPLEHAVCQFDVVKVTEILDEDDTDVTDTSNNGGNALHGMVQKYADLDNSERTEVKTKFLAILSKLVAKGLDINAPILGGKTADLKNPKFTALHIAASSPNSGDILRAMFSSGANVNVEDRHKRTPLHVATDEALLSNIQALLDGGANPNSQDEYGQTPLHYAVKGRRRPIEVIQTIIEAGGDTNVKDTTGKTPIHVAAKHANDKVMHLMLSRGGLVKNADGTGQTPVHYAALHDCSGKVLKELLKYTSEINAQDSVSGESPLHKAVRHHMTENVITLCESGHLDPNIQDLYGETPIHKAVKLQDWNLWISLLKSGGDIYRENSNGVTPLILLKREHNKLGPLISKYNKERQTEV